jgi:hypothetical protein
MTPLPQGRLLIHAAYRLLAKTKRLPKPSVLTEPQEKRTRKEPRAGSVSMDVTFDAMSGDRNTSSPSSSSEAKMVGTATPPIVTSVSMRTLYSR